MQRGPSASTLNLTRRTLLGGLSLTAISAATSQANAGVQLRVSNPFPLLGSLPSQAAISSAVSQCSVRTAPSNNIAGIADLYQSDAAVRGQIKSSGVRWVRLEFNWSIIETSPGVYDWSSTDAIIADYASAGISVLGLINYVAGSLLSTWQDIDARWQTFVAALVDRYSGQGIHYWEIFNEPNLVGYGWLASGLDASQFWGAYTLLLARASKIIHALDPAGYVVLGGMSSGGIAFAPIYALGAANCFDIFAFHPYGDVGQFAAVKSAISSGFTAAVGDVAKPIWITEIGTTTETNPTRSSFVDDLFNPAKERGIFDATFLLSMRDSPAGAYGFYNADNSLKSDGALATFVGLMP